LCRQDVEEFAYPSFSDSDSSTASTTPEQAHQQLTRLAGRLSSKPTLTALLDEAFSLYQIRPRTFPLRVECKFKGAHYLAHLAQMTSALALEAVTALQAAVNSAADLSAQDQVRRGGVITWLFIILTCVRVFCK
jgi:hypothetical protein